ncbi:MAG3450 family membrane protein [Mycoplasma elephantis]|uniref:MAG3450 family membrane protein n=1 Tax=Mycoplasma elephantis TaxID=114882 RepID=UPI0004812994|nr:hypothetical protein [Mycoplasma elephantis]
MNNQQKTYIFIVFYLICVIFPLSIIWVFFGYDVRVPVLKWQTSIWISIVGVFLIVLLDILLIYLKLLNLNTLIYVVPFCLVMLSLTYSYFLPMWARFLITFTCVLIAIPINYFIYYLEDLKQKAI